MNFIKELRNFMNAWSQEQEEEQQELHESFANRLYECKPVKRNKIIQIQSVILYLLYE